MTYKYKINGGFLIWVPIQSDWLEYRHNAIHDEVVSVLGNIPTHVCNTVYNTIYLVAFREINELLDRITTINLNC